MTGFTIATAQQFNFRATVLSHGWLMLAPFSWDEAGGTLHYVYQTAAGAMLRLCMSEAESGVRVDLPDYPAALDTTLAKTNCDPRSRACSTSIGT